MNHSPLSGTAELSPASAYPNGGALPFLLDGEAVNRRLSDRESQLFGEPGSVKIDYFVRLIDELRAVAEEATDFILETEVRFNYKLRFGSLRIVDALFEKRVPRGFPYFDLLDRIHQHLLPRTYVEIGVSTGRSLTLALPGTMSVGIDPDPRLSFPLRRGTRIFHQTSDDFFANHNLTRLFGGIQLDLALIDGMHHFEVALRDFMNLEKSSSIGTTILIHDCLPIDEVQLHVVIYQHLEWGRMAPEWRSYVRFGRT